jgi:thiosulfate/3-mercaptopyruvate sulfurtransferase
MENLVNYEKLVTPEWIEQLISDRRPKNYPDKELRLFDVGWGNVEEYISGHIPGAIHLDLSSIERSPSWNKCSDDDLLEFLLAQGITCKSLVVLYGKDITAVARAACIMMYAGVDDVRILDGGYNAWLNAGYSVETGFQQPIPVKTFGRIIPGHPEYIIGINKAKALLADEQGMLVSVRSWEEYIGETSGYDFIKSKGRIAGAVWGYSGSDPHQMRDYRNLDNTMRSYHEIASLWQSQGITPDKNVGIYCGTGWRASEAFFYAYLMGRQNIAVFDGGWLEWSQDVTNPIERGIPSLPSDKL